jgi:D-xylose transport system permease protein
MAQEGAIQRFFRATEIDTRLVGMVGALLLVWIGMDLIGVWKSHGFTLSPSFIWDNSIFLSSRNLWNLLVQTSIIAILSTGMTMIIVMRHIDLSVGSMLSFIAVVVGVEQVYWLAPSMGSEFPFTWIIAVATALALGALLGAFNGYLVAYAGVPSFIVTLAGLIGFNGAAWWVIRGETVAPMDSRFELIGGNPSSAWIGANASWGLAGLTCAAIIFGLVTNRQARARFNFPQRPMWAEVFLAVIGCFFALGVTWIMNDYLWPPAVAARYARDNGITLPPEGLNYSHGYAIPMLIAAGVGLFMTFLTSRTAFGRYIYSIGGNPEAAELAGINTRWMTLLMFSLMGILAGLSSCIASARLDAASNSLGLTDELYAIASAVIGGTSLAGGVGTIYGSMLGALFMTSLQSGMTLLNLDSAVKDVVTASVLIFAVWLDQVYRRRQT